MRLIMHSLAHRLTVWRVVMLSMLLVLVTGPLFFTATRVGIDENRTAVDTLSNKSTVKIVHAQHTKAGLAAMDTATLEYLASSDPQQRQALIGTFEDRRAEVTKSLLSAAENPVYGAAELIPLHRIQFELPLYVSLVEQARKEHDSGDNAAAWRTYERARFLMEGPTMMWSSADFLDKSNSLALNDTYSELVNSAGQRDGNAIKSGVVLLVVLIGSSIYMALRYRRGFSLPVLGACLLTVGWLVICTQQYGGIQTEMEQAVNNHFQSVHVMWRAEAQANIIYGDRLRVWAGPGEKTAAYQRALDADGRKMLVQSAEDLNDMGGYIGSGFRAAQTPEEKTAMAVATKHYERLVAGPTGHDEARAELRDSVNALQQMRDVNQTLFDRNMSSAQSRVEMLERYNLWVVLSIMGLSVLGLWLRAKEVSA